MNNFPGFNAGDDVEIISPEFCMRGTLFPARVIGLSHDKTKVIIEYKTLVSKDADTGPLVEEVRKDAVRPKQPEENGGVFKLGDAVDAFSFGGWWEGVITEVLESGKFAVCFRFTREQHEFEGSDLRIHREWTGRGWAPAVGGLDDEESLNTTLAVFKTHRKYPKFRPGGFVEIRTDEDGLKGAYFAATIIQQEGKGKYLVEYRDLQNDDNTESLKEVVRARHIRPYPPEAVVVDGYNLNERVDALYNEGWWEGRIIKVLSAARYKVYFKGTDEEMVFKHFNLRPHQDWINGTWMSSQV